MVERLSLTDDTLISSYVDHIQRYQFALPYCAGKRVLDAGCGVGYGASFLASNGATTVTALDISEDALAEANRSFKKPNLNFHRLDVETINGDLGEFDTIVNFENLEHLQRPDRLVRSAAAMAGTFITSTPNGALTKLNSAGKPSNPFHVKEFTEQELRGLLCSKFRTVALYGQWLTHNGKLRRLRSWQLFEQLSETYHNPMNRIGRIIKRGLGRKCAPPPAYQGDADAFDGDYVIKRLDDEAMPWAPVTLIAVCENI